MKMLFPVINGNMTLLTAKYDIYRPLPYTRNYEKKLHYWKSFEKKLLSTDACTTVSFAV